MEEIEIEVAFGQQGGARAASALRARIATVARQHGFDDADTLHNLQVCTSEVATNAVLHGHADPLLAQVGFTTGVEPGPGAYGQVTVYVFDRGVQATEAFWWSVLAAQAALPSERGQTDPLAETGHGLTLLNGHSHRWGAIPTARARRGHSTKCVWFTVRHYEDGRDAPCGGTEAAA